MSNTPARPCTTTALLWQNSLSWISTPSATCLSTGLLSPVSLLPRLAPPHQCVDGLPERGPALGEGVGTHVVGERNPVQDARRLQFPQPSGEDVRGCAELALEVAVPLCAVE